MDPDFSTTPGNANLRFGTGVSGEDDETAALDATSSVLLASPSGAPASTSKRRRSTVTHADGCRTCRLRKVKCSGNPGHGPCAKCARLDLKCSFVEASDSSGFQAKISRSTPSQSHTEAGTPRKRAQKACGLCHLHKTKCSGDLPKCKRCVAGGHHCNYPAVKSDMSVPTQLEGNAQVESRTQQRASYPGDRDGTFAPSPGRSSHSGNFPLLIDVSALTAEELLLRKNLILRHFDAFQKHLYPLPSMGFLHPQKTLQEIQDGSISPAKAAAICGAACFFVNPGEASREFGTKCNDQVEFHLFRNIYQFSGDSLILYGLNLAFNFLNGSFAKVWTCFGIATRLMLGLQANWETQAKGKTFIQQECQRRVAWYIWNMDRLLAGGFDEYVSCRNDIMKIRLPCNETAFRENRPVVAEKLQDKPGKSRGALGLHGWQLRLHDIRHRIQVMTRRLMPGSGVNRSQLEPSRVMADINNFQHELTRLHTALPEDLRLTDQNIARFVPTSDQAGYAWLHSHLSVAHLDLYRFALPNMHEQTATEVLRQLPPDFVVKCQKQTLGHALCLARFFEAMFEEMEKQPLDGSHRLVGDVTIVHMSTQCIRILLIGLQHDLYQDLEKHTTAPLWRYKAVDEAGVRSLIESLFRAAEPWCEVMTIAKKAHESNKAMLADFDKTREFSDQKGTAGFSGPKPVVSNGTRLPGPHFILENVSAGMQKDEAHIKAGDAAAADRWFTNPNNRRRSSQQEHHDDNNDNGTSTLFATPPLMEEANEADSTPPGVPIFLAQAIGAAAATAVNPTTRLPQQQPQHLPPPLPSYASAAAPDGPDSGAGPTVSTAPGLGTGWHPSDGGSTAGAGVGPVFSNIIKPPPWTMAEMAGMMGDNQMMAPDAVHMLPLDPDPAAYSNNAAAGGSSTAAHPQHQHPGPPPPPPQQFMPSQPQIFMGAFNGGHYAGDHQQHQQRHQLQPPGAGSQAFMPPGSYH